MNDSINDQYEEAGIDLSLVDDNEARVLLMKYNRGLLSAVEIKNIIADKYDRLDALAQLENDYHNGK